MLNSLIAFQRLPRDVRLYMWSWGCLGFGYFGIFGVLFNLYLLRLGYGPETIGLLVAVGQVVWGLAAIPAGMVGGRFGNRNATAWGVDVMAVATALLLCSQLLPVAWQGAWITIWWVASWVGSALVLVNGSPYVMALIALEERQDVFTVQQILTSVLGFAGSLAAGVLPTAVAMLMGSGTDNPIVYWVALLLAPLSYFVAVKLMHSTQPLQLVRHEAASSHDTKMPLFLIVFVAFVIFLQTTGEGTIRSFFNVYLDRGLAVPLSQIGVVMGLGQFLPILSSLAAPVVLHRWGTGYAIVIAAIGSAFFMGIMALFPNWLAASFAYIGVLLLISLASISRGLYSQESVPAQWRTVMSSAFTIGISLGWSSASGLGGYLIENFGYRTLFLLGALASVAAGILLWTYLRTGRVKKVAGKIAI